MGLLEMVGGDSEIFNVWADIGTLARAKGLEPSDLIQKMMQFASGV